MRLSGVWVGARLSTAIKEKAGSAASAAGTDLGGFTALDDDLVKKLQDGKSLL